MKRILLTTLTAATLAGCATQGYLSSSSVGYPAQALFTQETNEELQARFVTVCEKNGYRAEIIGKSRMECGKTMTGISASLAHMRIGNKYTRTPERKLSVYFDNRPNGITTTLYEWIQAQERHGKVWREEQNSLSDAEKMQDLLFEMGAVPLEDD